MDVRRLMRLKAGVEEQGVEAGGLGEMERVWNKQMRGVVGKVDVLLVEMRGMKPDVGSTWRHMEFKV